MNIKKIAYIILGCLGLILGVIGAILPLLPAFPFLLLAAYSFAKSSKRLHTWFIHTRLYKNNLESYINGQGMTWRVKIRIMILVSILMSMGFVMMHQIVIGQVVLVLVWLFHIIYFTFGIKSVKTK